MVDVTHLTLWNLASSPPGSLEKARAKLRSFTWEDLQRHQDELLATARQWSFEDLSKAFQEPNAFGFGSKRPLSSGGEGHRVVRGRDAADGRRGATQVGEISLRMHWKWTSRASFSRVSGHMARSRSPPPTRQGGKVKDGVDLKRKRIYITNIAIYKYVYL